VNEFYEGWTEAPVAAIENIGARWVPPTDKPWYKPVSAFRESVDVMLASWPTPSQPSLNRPSVSFWVVSLLRVDGTTVLKYDNE
jgi:hypothetical protein